jgi:hypothetical protein
MISRSLLWIYSATIALLYFSTSAVADSQVFGIAYDRESGQLLYREYHQCRSDSLECSVDYRDPSGDLIARKELDYTASLTRPVLVMNDYRSGLELNIEQDDRKGLVVDAGFDHFVRGKWADLISGDVVRFPFLVAGFDEPLKMRAGLDKTISCPAQELCLEIALDSWVMRFLADPIGLVYSRDDRKLLRYQGLSNIRGEQNESLFVDIHYQYEDPVPTVGSAVRQKLSTYNF